MEKYLVGFYGVIPGENCTDILGKFYEVISVRLSGEIVGRIPERLSGVIST